MRTIPPVNIMNICQSRFCVFGHRWAHSCAWHPELGGLKAAVIRGGQAPVVCNSCGKEVIFFRLQNLLEGHRW